MSDRNSSLHDRDTNRFTNGGDNIFTCALGRRLYTASRNFQTVSAHALSDFINLGHRICSKILSLWTGSLSGKWVKKSQGEGRETLSLPSPGNCFTISPTESLFTGYTFLNFACWFNFTFVSCTWGWSSSYLSFLLEFHCFAKFCRICCQFIELQINFVCFSPLDLLNLIQCGHIGIKRRNLDER